MLGHPAFASSQHGDISNIGSGYILTGMFQIIFMYKKLQGDTMEVVIFGKRQGFAYKPGEPLAKRIVPAFDVGGFSRFFAYRLVVFAKHTLVGLPKVAVGMGASIGLRNAFP